MAERLSIQEIAKRLKCDPRAVRYQLEKRSLAAQKSESAGRPRGSFKPKAARAEIHAEPEGLGLGSDWAGEFRHLLTPETLARLEAWEEEKNL